MLPSHLDEVVRNGTIGIVRNAFVEAYKSEFETLKKEAPVEKQAE